MAASARLVRKTETRVDSSGFKFHIRNPKIKPSETHKARQQSGNDMRTIFCRQGPLPTRKILPNHCRIGYEFRGSPAPFPNPQPAMRSGTIRSVATRNRSAAQCAGMRRRTRFTQKRPTRWFAA